MQLAIKFYRHCPSIANTLVIQKNVCRDLSENFLTVITRQMLEGPRKLKNLQLDKNFIRCIDDDAVKYQTELEYLTFSRNNLTTLGEDLFIRMKNLRVL